MSRGSHLTSIRKQTAVPPAESSETLHLQGLPLPDREGMLITGSQRDREQFYMLATSSWWLQGFIEPWQQESSVSELKGAEISTMLDSTEEGEDQW